MTIRNLAEIPSDCQVRSPFCIVGAGIAGLLLATRLARKNKTVVVLESGNAAFDPVIHGLNQIENPSGRYSRELNGRYRGLGGSSTRWGGRMIPISEHDSQPRPHVSESGWPLALSDLERYNHEIEDLFSIGRDSYEEIDQKGQGIPWQFPSDEETFKIRWAKCPTFKRCNIATLLRQELESRTNVTVWLGATACDFDIDRTNRKLNAIGARNLNGKRITVNADNFIIAAGTIESTRMLLLMREASDRNAFARCNVLGRYFQDHLKAEVATIDRRESEATNRLFGYRFANSIRRDLHWELSLTAQREDAVSSAFAYVAMDLDGSPLDDVKKVAHGMQQRKLDFGDMLRVSKNFGLIVQSAYWRFLRNQLFVPTSIDFRVIICAEQLPDWNNRIRLASSRDSFGVRKVLLDWGPTEAEERTFRSAIKHLGKYWSDAGFDRVCPLIWNVVSKDLKNSIIDQAEACAHPSGSTRMGNNPTESVVGPDLRCHDLPNVAVASASVFPTAGSANPTFTIMKLALWLADSYPESVEAKIKEPALAG